MHTTHEAVNVKKNINYFIFFIFCLSNICFAADLEFVSSEELFPRLDFLTEKGEQINIKKWRGKVVILHFWATWCVYCIPEVEALDRFIKKLVDQELNEQIIIVPISVDAYIETVRGFYSSREIKNLAIYQDPSSMYATQLAVSSLPKTFIIDKMGREVAHSAGLLDWDNDEDLLNYIKSIIM